MKRVDFSYTNDAEYAHSRSLPCATQFLYLDDGTLRRLQSLELASYEGFPLRLDCFTVRGDRLKQIDWIEARLKEQEQEQDQKFRNALAEEYGSMVVPQIRNPQIREYVLLTNGKPAYVFLQYSGWADGCSVNLLKVISDCSTENEIERLKQTISECAMLQFSGGPEYWYRDDRAVFTKKALDISIKS
ncbi:hypothetical protein [uncultured Ruminococcus sp.]|uniref:hypothetical protein n=1 Tax=uncultured Ruminococcus sp. TaxID=165186 RepID=UPI00266BC1D9|nr:hypothetical protein [uncultured Ruminococcus sp.]